MSFNNPMDQMRRQQEELRRRQAAAAWAAEQEKKRKRHQRQANMQSGGINISDVNSLGVGGDMVGRDKIHQVSGYYPRDEKSGCALFIERAFAFAITFVVVGAIAGILGAIVMVILSNGATDIMILVVPVAVLIGLIAAFVNASSISRYRD